MTRSLGTRAWWALLVQWLDHWGPGHGELSWYNDLITGDQGIVSSLGNGPPPSMGPTPLQSSMGPTPLQSSMDPHPQWDLHPYNHKTASIQSRCDLVCSDQGRPIHWCCWRDERTTGYNRLARKQSILMDNLANQWPLLWTETSPQCTTHTSHG